MKIRPCLSARYSPTLAHLLIFWRRILRRHVILPSVSAERSLQRNVISSFGMGTLRDNPKLHVIDPPFPTHILRPITRNSLPDSPSNV